LLYLIPVILPFLNMFASTVLVPLVLAASALAFPMRRDDSPGCNASFSLNGVGYVKAFTLLAQYDNDTTIQKQLAIGPNGQPTTANSSTSLGTVESMESPQGQNFKMENSGIVALPDGYVNVPKSSMAVPLSGFLNFTPQAIDATPAPIMSYCEVVNTGANGGPYQDPILAVNDDSEGFSLCKGSTSDQVNVVYRADQVMSKNLFVWDTCEKVHIMLVQS